MFPLSVTDSLNRTLGRMESHDYFLRNFKKTVSSEYFFSNTVIFELDGDEDSYEPLILQYFDPYY